MGIFPLWDGGFLYSDGRNMFDCTQGKKVLGIGVKGIRYKE
jgi:hypothetical protein